VPAPTVFASRIAKPTAARQGLPDLASVTVMSRCRPARRCGPAQSTSHTTFWWCGTKNWARFRDPVQMGGCEATHDTSAQSTVTECTVAGETGACGEKARHETRGSGEGNEHGEPGLVSDRAGTARGPPRLSPASQRSIALPNVSKKVTTLAVRHGARSPAEPTSTVARQRHGRSPADRPGDHRLGRCGQHVSTGIHGRKPSCTAPGTGTMRVHRVEQRATGATVHSASPASCPQTRHPDPRQHGRSQD